MQVLGQRGVGLACIAFLVLAMAPAGHSVHEDPSMVVVLSPADLGFRISDQEQTLRLEVTNPHATEAAERLTLTVPAGDELVSFVGATAAGWTATASDTGSDGNNDKLVLTGTLAAGAKTEVEVRLRVLATQESTAGEQPTGVQDVTVLLESTTPTPVSSLGEETIHSLSFHNSRIVANPSLVLLEEGGSADTTQVRLAANPGFENGQPVTVTVQVATTDASVATVSPSTLTFEGGDPEDIETTPGTWNTPQTLTITPTSGDSVDGGTQDIRLNLRYGNLPLAAGLSVPVFVADDDQAGIVLIEQPADEPTIVTEGSDTDTVGVRLATQPTAQVNLSLSISPNGQATLDKTTLSFDGSNWQTPQPVTITAVDDAVEESLVTTARLNVAVTGTATRDDGYDDAEAASLALSVVDNEGVGVIVEQSEGFTLVTEALGSRSDDFTVVLARQPLMDVTIDLQLGTASSNDLSVLPSSITFTPSNWLIPKQVVVTAVDDDLGEGTEIASIDVVVNAASSPEYKKVAKQTVLATITDDEVRGFVPVITSTNQATSETSGTAANDVTIGVELSARPDADVGLTVTSTDTSEIIVQSGATLLFTPDNWDTAQSIVLRGVDDDLHDGHQAVNITFAPTAASHPLWRDLDPLNLTLVNRDNEHSVMLRPTTLALEEGSSSTYELSLTRPPATAQTVKVVIAPPAGLAVASSTAQSSSNETGRIILSFSAADVPQTVRVTAVDDQEALGDRELRITHSATSGDSDYHGVPVADLVVNVTDDERFDLAAANRALQQTVEVSRRGGDNHVTWDISAVGGEPAGVQIWRSSSPFAIVATLHEDGPEYRDGAYRDRDGRASDQYVVTVFYGPTAAEGRFPSNTFLSLVPGYLGLSLAEQQGFAQAAPDDSGLSTGTWVAILVAGAVLLIVLIVLIAVATRKKEPSDEEDWDGPVEAWQPTQAPPTDEQTFHLTCPRCGNDFDAVGQKPLVTHCPHCGVEGVLR